MLIVTPLFGIAPHGTPSGLWPVGGAPDGIRTHGPQIRKKNLGVQDAPTMSKNPRFLPLLLHIVPLLFDSICTHLLPKVTPARHLT